MAQFYETYVGNPKLATLLREISWSNNLLIMASTKTDEAREFYIRTAIQNKYSFSIAEIGNEAELEDQTICTQINKETSS
jgi:hypothetical protein